MESNKFVNLRKEYKDFIDNIVPEIEILKIDEKITKSKCYDILTVYTNICLIINETSLNYNDINHIILNYNKENKNVELLRKFIEKKNLILIKQIITSQLWKPFIYKLYETIKPNIKNKKMDEKVLIEKLEKGVYDILLSTTKQFKGCWEIAEFKDNKLKKLDIVEPEQIEYLINIMNNKKTKNV